MGMYEGKLLGYDSKLLSIGGKLLRLFATGLYTFDEVNTMILTQNYIPVSTAAELDALRTTTIQTMGVGSPWEGTYTTGLNKKYVQVNVIDLIGYQSGDGWVRIGNDSAGFSGVYDGNELAIKNLMINDISETSTNSSLLGRVTGSVNNVVLFGSLTQRWEFLGSGIGKGVGGIVSFLSGGEINNCVNYTEIEKIGTSVYMVCGGVCGYNYEGTISNCINYGEIKGQYSGGICGYARGGTIETSTNYGNLSGATYVGGICGGAVLSTTITGCENNATITATGGYSGGICGNSITSTITYCQSSGSLTTTSTNAGGIAGRASGVVEFCSTSMSITSSSTSAPAYVSGCVGVIVTPGTVLRNSFSTGAVTMTSTGSRFSGFSSAGSGTSIVNCYSTGLVTGTGVIAGGFSGYLGGTITNCYWDKDTSGRSTSLGGSGRTTAQMKQGTSSSFINPDGSADATEDPANAMYTSWDGVNIWDFLTTADYPVLK